MQIGARIARAQLDGLARSRRQIVVGPLVGLLHDEDAWYLSTMVAAEPGKPFDPEEVREALAVLRQAFRAEGRWLSAELIEEANPGLADELETNGMKIVSRPPLLVVEPDELVDPTLPAGVTALVISSDAEQAEANAIAADAYAAEGVGFTYQPVHANGGGVVIRVDGVPAATAAWTAVADGVTEVAGVGTIHSHRRRGLAGIATAYATQQAFELAGATLAWLTPGDDGADRVYRRVGYSPQATAVHLGDPGGHLADLR
ncbi:GNAT family N-acetyltransferase [Kribbella sandramycini]|uniref:GNAT family N-acetyltransferase n=1 Tax=Kribbella sandramycini TaxID=60450 RepID=A0A7Y4L5V8_9ACTN|nr:GNAT family N-acetyltransferase [Kribbella sandramycini]MBB6565926.1 putative GNAT family acetyltransferase [Kribbella sandramycini]NOL44932.1 GNAT family N-acetyltransferase [Kribbella sandramycini]